jgi:hypothetical protein
MRVAAMIVGAEMLVITLTPNLAGQQASAAAQTVNFVPTAVKLEDLDQPTASKWRTISAFPAGMDYFFVPKPMDANGLARRDFSVASLSGSPKGQASLLLLQSQTAATLLASLGQEILREDANLETAFSASPSTKPGSATCLTTLNRTTKERRIVCYVVWGPKMFELDVAAPGDSVSAAMIAETKEVSETAASFADAFTTNTTAPHIDTSAIKPDPATAAVAAAPPSEREDVPFQAVTLASLDAKSKAAFDRTKTWTYSFSKGYGVTGDPVSLSTTYAEYTRTLSGPGVDPASTVEYRIYERQISAMLFAGRAGRGMDPAWLPTGHGAVEMFKTASGDIDHDGDIRCFSSPLSQIGKVVARCFTAPAVGAVAVTLIANGTSDDIAKSNVLLAANLASAAAKTFQEIMDDLKK